MDDQTIKKDAGKPRLSLVPMQIVYDIAEVRGFGVEKYGDNESWKEVQLQRYIDTMLRHTLAFVRDPCGVDEESGISHYKHAECNWAFISELMRTQERNTERALSYRDMIERYYNTPEADRGLEILRRAVASFDPEEYTRIMKEAN